MSSWDTIQPQRPDHAGRTFWAIVAGCLLMIVTFALIALQVI